MSKLVCATCFSTRLLPIEDHFGEVKEWVCDKCGEVTRPPKFTIEEMEDGEYEP